MPTVYTNFSMWPALWFINSFLAFPNEHPELDHQSVCLFSQIWLYLIIKVSRAIRITGKHAQGTLFYDREHFSNSLSIVHAQTVAQKAIKISQISSHSVTAWGNCIPVFLTIMSRHVLIFWWRLIFLVYFLSACVLMRTWWFAVMSCACQLVNYTLATEDNGNNVRVCARCSHFAIIWNEFYHNTQPNNFEFSLKVNFSKSFSGKISVIYWSA